MEVFAIPLEDKYILYRPLLRLAFVGNKALARLVMGLDGENVDELRLAAGLRRELSVDRVNEALGRAGSSIDIALPVLGYLRDIGFLEPDPPPPRPRDALYRPTNAVVLSTSRCNLRCVYCYADAGEGEAQDVSIDLAQTAIDQVYQNAKELGRSRFELTFHGGGEPTLTWETLERAVVYARAKDLPCHISMVSNGIWTDRQGDWLVENLNSLTISLDGARETQDRQRPFVSGRGSFKAVMKTIRTLDRYGFDYGIRMTALAPWRGRLASDVQFIVDETGSRSMQVEPAFNTDRGEYRPPSWQECKDFEAGFMEAFEVAQRAGRRLHFSGARPWTLSSTFCSAPYGGLIVTPSGGLVTCYEITSPQHPLAGLCTIGRIENGNVVVDETKRNAFLSRLEARRRACRDCFCYWHCGGDCHAKTFYPGTDATPMTSTRCRMNRAILVQQLLRFIATSDDGVYHGTASD